MDFQLGDLVYCRLLDYFGYVKDITEYDIILLTVDGYLYLKLFDANEQLEVWIPSPLRKQIL
jgi:hypothetical protein